MSPIHKYFRALFWSLVYVVLILYVLRFIWTILVDWKKSSKDWRLTRAARRAWLNEWNPYNGGYRGN